MSLIREKPKKVDIKTNLVYTNASTSNGYFGNLRIRAMNHSFSHQVKFLKANVFSFGQDAQLLTESAFQQLSRRSIPKSMLLDYQETLLSYASHPGNKKIYEWAIHELKRIAKISRSLDRRSRQRYLNSGLPYSEFLSNFSHDFLRWLQKHAHCQIALHGDVTADLNQLLALSLPSLEKYITTAGYSNEELWEQLGISEKHRLDFLLKEVSSLEAPSDVKDYLFEMLDLQVKLVPRNEKFSKPFNRLFTLPLFTFNECLKTFNYKRLWKIGVPVAETLSPLVRNKIAACIKTSMALTNRETDPITYMSEKELQFYALERGVQVAIYPMKSERQLPVESYVGYTVFRNGYPMAYGGAWVFGQRANFGIHIFNEYRGGESGYIFCQLIRLYHQLFKVSLFEIEPYQFGLDNSEGISSGAFWFYYRFGFRPVDAEMKKLATKEFNKRKTKGKYRHNKVLLKQFTSCNLELRLEKINHPSLATLSEKVTHIINTRYKGDRRNAITAAIDKLQVKFPYRNLTPEQQSTFVDFGLLLHVLPGSYKAGIGKIIDQLVRWKGKNMFVYQEHLLALLRSIY